MELERHIEILLLDNDCVIVPGLGGFIAYHTDARYDAESASFLPPSRVAGFNPKLTMNDNLLAQSYVETYDISYPEAVKKIAEEADALKSNLERNGYYEISGVGTLRVNDKGGYDFAPFEAGLLTPEYYGLGCFEALKTVVQDTVKEVTDNEEMEEAKENSKKFIKIRISTIRNVAAAAIAIFAFFLLSSPLGNNDKNMASVASLQSDVFTKMIPQNFSSDVKDVHKDVVEIKKPTIKVTEAKQCAPSDSAKTIKAEIKEENKTVTETKKVTTETKEIKKATKADNYYCIVLASALSKHNANNFVKKLTNDGLKDIYAIDCSNGMKVVCGHHATEKEAWNSLDTLRANQNFKDAWVYKVKVKG